MSSSQGGIGRLCASDSINDRRKVGMNISKHVFESVELHSECWNDEDRETPSPATSPQSHQQGGSTHARRQYSISLPRMHDLISLSYFCVRDATNLFKSVNIVANNMILISIPKFVLSRPKLVESDDGFLMYDMKKLVDLQLLPKYIAQITDSYASIQIICEVPFSVILNGCFLDHETRERMGESQKAHIEEIMVVGKMMDGHNITKGLIVKVEKPCDLSFITSDTKVFSLKSYLWDDYAKKIKRFRFGEVTRMLLRRVFSKYTRGSSEDLIHEIKKAYRNEEYYYLSTNGAPDKGSFSYSDVKKYEDVALRDISVECKSPIECWTVYNNFILHSDGNIAIRYIY